MFEFEELKALVASVERADSDRGGGYRAISVDSKDIYRCCELLRDRFDYPLLLDITAVDRLKLTARPKVRFKLVYIFRHANFRDTLIVETPLREGEEKLESITSLFFSADWLERETYDQYGIEFTALLPALIAAVISYMVFSLIFPYKPLFSIMCKAKCKHITITG